MNRVFWLCLCTLFVALCQGKQYFIISNESGGWDCNGLAAAVQAKLGAADTVGAFCGQIDPPSDLSQYDGIITWLNGQSVVNAKIEAALTKYLVARRGIVVFASFSLNFFTSTFLLSYSPLVATSLTASACYGSSYGTCNIVDVAADTVFNKNLAWDNGGYYLGASVALATHSRSELVIFNSYSNQLSILAATRYLATGGVTAFVNIFPFDNYPNAGVATLFANAVSSPFPTGNIANCAEYAGLNCKTCATGYLVTSDGLSCYDVNECLIPLTCPWASTCTNTVGSYTCSNYWFFIVNQQTNLTLEQETSTIASAMVVKNRKTIGFQNQLFQITPDGYIVNYATGFVLDAMGDKLEIRTPIIGYSRKSLDKSANQLWAYDSTYGYVINKAANLILDVFESSTEPGAYTILWYYKNLIDYNGAYNQRWNLVLPWTSP